MGGPFDTPEAALASAELMAQNHLRGRIAAVDASGDAPTTLATASLAQRQ